MIGRTVEVAQDGRHLSVLRGFLVVKEKGEEVGRVPLDDIGVLLCNAHGLTYSTNLVTALSERGAPVVFCGRNHQPAAIALPIQGHHRQTARTRAQIEASRPLRKSLWKSLIRAKVGIQGAVLEHLGKPAGAFQRLAASVRSGDPDNVEAQAARRYWPLLMGEDFRRDSDGDGANALLNYGYTILRSATARSVIAAGLHPSVGVHHESQYNALCLVDDLMEPFRPIVDLVVFRLLEAGRAEVDAETKAALADVLAFDMEGEAGVTPLATCLHRLATSLGQSYEIGKAALVLPKQPLPLELSTAGRAGT